MDGFVGRYEVLKDRVSGRQTWPLEAKRQIVAESHAPGAMVSEVARRHRLMPSQVTTWRRLHREGKLGMGDAKVSPAFVPLMLAEPEAEAEPFHSATEPEPMPGADRGRRGWRRGDPAVAIHPRGPDR